MKFTKSNIKWIFLLIFVILIGITRWSILVRMIIRYGTMILLFLGVALIFYYFFYDAILQKCKVCRKLKSFLGACIISALCIFAYVQIKKPPTNIRMKENILYVKPKSPIQIDPNDIYDGSENDPNLKQQDEGTIRMQEDILYVHPKADTTIKK